MNNVFLHSACLLLFALCHGSLAAAPKPDVLLNQKDDGYRGIWYCNEPQKDEYVYKYSGGLGTYCSSHSPFAVYCPQVHKTFFCYGGTRKDTSGRRTLLHEVAYYDHATGMVPRPTILLDKQTDDAHDDILRVLGRRRRAPALALVAVFLRPGGERAHAAPTDARRARATESLDFAGHLTMLKACLRVS